jgi:hypothetical protein
MELLDHAKRKRTNEHVGCKVKKEKKGVTEGGGACMRVCLGWVTLSVAAQDDEAGLVHVKLHPR